MAVPRFPAGERVKTHSLGGLAIRFVTVSEKSHETVKVGSLGKGRSQRSATGGGSPHPTINGSRINLEV